MKKLLLGLIASFIVVFVGNAQSNNPQNQFGLDIIKFAVTVKNDINTGKLKELNQTEIDRYYNALLKGQEKPSLENYQLLLDKIKVFDPKNFIKNTEFSEEAKNFLLASLTDISTTELVNQVNNSKISTLEKEIVLKVLAINYNFATSYNYKPVDVGRGPSGTNEFLIIEDNYYSKGLSLLGGAVFYIAGNALCGPLCGWAAGALGVILVNSFPTTFTPNTPRPSGSGGGSNGPKP